MHNKLNTLFLSLLTGALMTGLMGCDSINSQDREQAMPGHENKTTVAAQPKGPNGGRLLVDGEFALELAIFETGVPPEFHVWATDGGSPISPDQIEVRVTLNRLGDGKDEIGFKAQGDFLRGDMVIYEPHSFVVLIEARYKGATHRWQYDNFEGRTRIGPDVALAFGLETEFAGPATIHETIAVYGRIVPIEEQVRAINARFDGVIKSMTVSIGDTVRQGQTLATIESNESLKNYKVTAPIDGVVTERSANPGEQTSGRQLFRIVDATTVWAELAVFPSARARVQAGAKVIVGIADGNITRTGVVARINTIAEANQSILARVKLENADGAFAPGMYLTGEIQVADHAVPLAVKRTGLQSFRDFTVVYAQIDDEYEVRMLELGRQDALHVEVLGGLGAGTRYVTANSYVVKADIEKSGASHDH